MCPLQITHPAQERLATPPGSTSPTLFDQWCGFLYVPQEPDKCKCCETGPTVFRPYPRRLESLTICRCHCKGSIFSSVILETLSVGPAGVLEPLTSRSADRRSPNWANKAAAVMELNAWICLRNPLTPSTRIRTFLKPRILTVFVWTGA